MTRYLNHMNTKFYTCLLFILSLLMHSSCKKETEYLYKVNDVAVRQSGTTKQNTKTTTEFISIAYSDLFNANISTASLNSLSLAYSAFGDQKLIENLIIKNFLNIPGAAIPTKAAMNMNVPDFVTNTYKKFLNRVPNAFEQWNLVNIIKKDTTTTPELVYYGFMTSNEYRKY